jgi:peptide-methionine (S)-S-oxide reductase
MRELTFLVKAFAVILAVVSYGCAGVEGQTTALPDASVDAPLAQAATPQKAVFAGGCFWGVEAVFEHVKGVTAVVSGYAGGESDTANYGHVSRGTSGHAEAVEITYDPSQISYGQLLKIFFAVAHDPTQLNRQGPDTGPQYRSEIFTVNAQQARIADAYIRQLTEARAYSKPIVTRTSPLPAFFEAEPDHQDFAARHPRHPYIVIHDRPKVEQLKHAFPGLYRQG